MQLHGFFWILENAKKYRRNQLSVKTTSSLLVFLGSVWSCEREAIPEFSSHLEIQLTHCITHHSLKQWDTHAKNKTQLQPEKTIISLARQKSHMNTGEQVLQKLWWCIRTNISTMWSDISRSLEIFGSKYFIFWQFLKSKNCEVLQPGNHRLLLKVPDCIPKPTRSGEELTAVSLLPLCMTFPFQKYIYTHTYTHTHILPVHRLSLEGETKIR